MRRRRLYLLSFLLHGVIEQREAVAEELLADHNSLSQHLGRGQDISVSHCLLDQHPDVLRGQAAGQNRLEERESEVSNRGD